MAPSFLVLNVRGTINAPHQVKRTLRLLNIPRRHMATIVPDTPAYRGMLQVVKDYVAWYKADSSTILEILEKRGRMVGGRPLNIDTIKEAGYKSYEELSKALEDSKTTLSKLKNVKPFFSLASPRGGFKRSVKKPYKQGGVLGENPELSALIRRML